MLLNDLTIKSLKPADKPYKKSDGDGLYLYVDPSGGKRWRIGYRFHGKRKTVSGGIYPHISLGNARKWRGVVKEQLARGEDPSFIKREEKRKSKQSADTTFEKVARHWFDSRRGHRRRPLGQTTWCRSSDTRIAASNHRILDP